MTLRPPTGELELIARLAEIFGKAPPEVILGISDDCAALDLGGPDYLLWTIDALVEGVHFDLASTSLRQLGEKSLAVNLSDLAAMGGEPRYALLSLGWPPERDLAGALEFGAGLAACAGAYGVAVIGGDTVASPGQLSIALTVLGRVPKNEMLRRSGTRAGDLVYVTGPLGEAAAGLAILCHQLPVDPHLGEPLIRAHLSPRPQVAAGRLLARERLASACIDLSDGVATDLMHLCRRSGVGARLAAADLPVPDGVRWVAEKIGREFWELALQSGEDYQLLFTCPPDRARHLGDLFSRAGLAVPSPIGEIVPGGDVIVIINGKDKIISGGGYEHFRLDPNQTSD
ncbi:MAG: thiamine-phosphate kinase [Desulfobaccales bacterium]